VELAPQVDSDRRWQGDPGHSEFAVEQLDEGVTLDFSRPEKPTDNV
jgi:hypothetical protein